jgi:2-phosphosulfolactate phosphatase
VEDPHSQHRYQVRFEYGAAGAAAVGNGVEVVVWVDVLDTDPGVVQSAASAAGPDADDSTGPDASSSGADAATAPNAGSPTGNARPTDPLDGVLPLAAVVAGGFRNRTAVAHWVLDRQAAKGDRFTVAVIVAGARRTDGTPRFTVEDMLAAGAVVDALAGVGIDYCSPEAAAACAAFTSLSRATAHLVSASGSGQQLIDLGRRSDVDDACEIDAAQLVPVLREVSRP